jgi:hypothetical protein
MVIFIRAEIIFSRATIAGVLCPAACCDTTLDDQCRGTVIRLLNEVKRQAAGHASLTVHSAISSGQSSSSSNPWEPGQRGGGGGGGEGG